MWLSVEIEVPRQAPAPCTSMFHVFRHAECRPLCLLCLACACLRPVLLTVNFAMRQTFAPMPAVCPALFVALPFPAFPLMRSCRFLSRRLLSCVLLSWRSPFCQFPMRSSQFCHALCCCSLSLSCPSCCSLCSFISSCCDWWLFTVSLACNPCCRTRRQCGSWQLMTPPKT